MGKTMLKVLMVIGVLLVLAIIASVWMVWKRPLTIDAMFSRYALSKLGFEKTTVPSPDGRMTVWIAGEGPSMVLLHGAGDQAGAWARMVPPLLDDYRLVIPDLPGHWKSDPRKGPLGVDRLLAGVEVVMDSVCAGEDTPTPVGRPGQGKGSRAKQSAHNRINGRPPEKGEQAPGGHQHDRAKDAGIDEMGQKRILSPLHACTSSYQLCSAKSA